MNIKCRQCGAAFDDQEAKCPYCGFFNYKGEEIKYIEKLYDIKGGMEELSKIPQMTYKKELKNQTKHVVHTVIIVAAIAFIVAGGIIGYYKIFGEQKSVSYKEQLLWQKEMFPKLD